MSFSTSGNLGKIPCDTISTGKSVKKVSKPRIVIELNWQDKMQDKLFLDSYISIRKCLQNQRLNSKGTTFNKLDGLFDLTP